MRYLFLVILPMFLFISCNNDNLVQPVNKVESLSNGSVSKISPYTVTIWDPGYYLTENKHTIYHVGLSVTTKDLDLSKTTDVEPIDPHTVPHLPGMMYDIYIKYSDYPTIWHGPFTRFSRDPAVLGGDVDGDYVTWWEVYIVFRWQGISTRSNTITMHRPD